MQHHGQIAQCGGQGNETSMSSAIAGVCLRSAPPCHRWAVRRDHTQTPDTHTRGLAGHRWGTSTKFVTCAAGRALQVAFFHTDFVEYGQ